MTCALVLAALALLPQDDRVAAWSEDVLALVAELERMHPRPYFACPQEEFERGVDEFLASLEGASDAQATVGLMRLMARLSRQGREGHALVWPLRAHHLPLQLYLFSDGWFVVAADEPEHVGARVTAIGGVPVAEACARLEPLLAHDNEWNLRTRLAAALTCCEVLEGVGLGGGGRVPVVLERGDRRSELVLAGEARDPFSVWGRHALPDRAGVPGLEGREQAFRLQVLAAEKALYVQFNEVTARDASGRKLADFAEELVGTFEDLGLARVIVDVRSNSGGDNTTFGPLIAALQAPAIDRPGVLFGLIGRETFSAAGNFVTVLERDTKAILVGEPTGGAPNQYGDARTVPLAHHPDVLVRIATRYHQFGAPDDPRLTHEPRIAVPLSSADHFAGKDPVLRAALDYQPPR